MWYFIWKNLANCFITARRHTQCENLNENMAMDKEFEEWYQQNERRFHCGHFDEKQIAYSAWIEGRNRALSMSGVVESADFPSINNEGTPLLDEYGKKICNCVDPNRTYFPDGAIVCMNCWGEWYH